MSKGKQSTRKHEVQPAARGPVEQSASSDRQNRERADSQGSEPFAPVADQAADEVAQLRDELDETKDRALRLQAELENYRKRAARQLDEERRYANLPLMRDLLPVLDNIDRAIEAAEKSPGAASLVEGFKMVGRLLEDTLKRHHCERIEAVGKPFDPDWHEAVAQQPTAEHPANTVVGEMQSGFQLHGRVVRPTQVIVATALPEAAAHADASEEGNCSSPE